MRTPNGRFAVDTRLCLSMSDFHPETWNPLWKVSTILSGLLSFMLEEEITNGSVAGSPELRRRYAHESLAFNLQDPAFRRLFPQFVEMQQKQQPPLQQQLPPQVAIKTEGPADVGDGSGRCRCGVREG